MSYTPPDTRKQEDALIAAKVAKTLLDEKICTDYVTDVRLSLNVSRASFYKYLKLDRPKRTYRRTATEAMERSMSYSQGSS